MTIKRFGSHGGLNVQLCLQAGWTCSLISGQGSHDEQNNITISHPWSLGRRLLTEWQQTAFSRLSSALSSPTWDYLIGEFWVSCRGGGPCSLTVFVSWLKSPLCSGESVRLSFPLIPHLQSLSEDGGIDSWPVREGGSLHVCVHAWVHVCACWECMGL